MNLSINRIHIAMLKNSQLFFSLFLSFALVFSGCDSKKSFSAKKGPLPEKNVSGPVLNVMLDTSIQLIDQQVSTEGTVFEIVGDLLDGLMQMAEDGSVVPAVAKSMSVSPDGLVYTFNLRDDSYWSNGEPVTARDFVYAWERACTPSTEAEYSYLMSDIAHIKNAVAIQAGQMDPNQLGVRALDDYTLQVQLEVPLSFFDQLLYFCTFYPANEKFIKSCGSSYGTSPETFLSNGAFLLKDFKPGASSLDLVKNTAYYDASKIQLGGIHYEVVKSPAEALSKFRSGQLDLIEVSGSVVGEVKDSPEFKTVESGFLWYLTANMEMREFANLNMRRAFTFAIDRGVITDSVIADGSRPTYTAIPSAFAFNSSGQDFTTASVEFPELCSYDPEKARECWRMAQNELGRSSFSFKLLTDDTQTQTAVANEIKRQLEATLPGLRIEVESIQKSARLDRMSEADFEIALTRWGPDYADPMTYLSLWTTGNENNYGRFSDPTYDAIIANCSDGELSTKLAERWSAMKDAEKIIMREAVIFPLYQQCGADLMKSNVKGVAFHPVGINRIYKNARK